ncbi:hypothetical protein AVEN_165755-1 [Araneus ventricosus]|uniref:Uncharacterized protein n=1 Tax=Araneus ventricosus TaxID=182803 RepID=A0A4Y2NHT3_ARAVE|nr:hypothetical protein AVEN_165755-1 [Araneus ventricosus]
MLSVSTKRVKVYGSPWSGGRISVWELNGSRFDIRFYERSPVFWEDCALNLSGSNFLSLEWHENSERILPTQCSRHLTTAQNHDLRPKIVLM